MALKMACKWGLLTTYMHWDDPPSMGWKRFMSTTPGGDPHNSVQMRPTFWGRSKDERECTKWWGEVDGSYGKYMVFPNIGVPPKLSI